jgi:hypothetical protein
MVGRVVPDPFLGLPSPCGVVPQVPIIIRIRDSEDVGIISHLPRLGRLWTILIQNLQGILGVSILVYRQMISNLTVLIVLRTLAGQFS